VAVAAGPGTVGVEVVIGEGRGDGEACIVCPHADKSKYKTTKTLALKTFFMLPRFPRRNAVK
jgi:hypothetical protein